MFGFIAKCIWAGVPLSRLLGTAPTETPLVKSHGVSQLWHAIFSWKFSKNILKFACHATKNFFNRLKRASSTCWSFISCVAYKSKKLCSWKLPFIHVCDPYKLFVWFLMKYTCIAVRKKNFRALQSFVNWTRRAFMRKLGIKLGYVQWFSKCKILI